MNSPNDNLEICSVYDCLAAELEKCELRRSKRRLKNIEKSLFISPSAFTEGKLIYKSRETSG